MPTVTNLEPFERTDLSGGMQRKSIKFLKRASEVDLAINASFGRVGGVEKSKGMSQLGNDITSTTSTSTSTTSSTTSTSTSTSTSSSTTSSSTTSSSTTTA